MCKQLPGRFVRGGGVAEVVDLIAGISEAILQAAHGPIRAGQPVQQDKLPPAAPQSPAPEAPLRGTYI